MKYVALLLVLLVGCKAAPPSTAGIHYVDVPIGIQAPQAETPPLDHPDVIERERGDGWTPRRNNDSTASPLLHELDSDTLD